MAFYNLTIFFFPLSKYDKFDFFFFMKHAWFKKKKNRRFDNWAWKKQRFRLQRINVWRWSWLIPRQSCFSCLRFILRILSITLYLGNLLTYIYIYVLTFHQLITKFTKQQKFSKIYINLSLFFFFFFFTEILECPFSWLMYWETWERDCNKSFHS